MKSLLPSVFRSLALASTAALVGGVPVAQDTADGPVRVSGRYPHLAIYNNQSECGIGVLVPWARKLWIMTYSPHAPEGSEDKLWNLTKDLRLVPHPESVGGTPAGRWLHHESGNMLLGHHVINLRGRVRTVPIEKMPGRITAIAEHLTHPTTRYYVLDMEGRLYEVDIRTLEPKLLFEKPVPGWHAKGAVTTWGRLIVTNNGELAARKFLEPPYLVGTDPQGPEDAGVLAEFDGKEWTLLKRRQFTEVTSVGDVRSQGRAAAAGWALGWDKRSVMLEVMHERYWWSYRMPKTDFSYDGRHGWHTEWPRIRKLDPQSPQVLTMHGGMFDLPVLFTSERDDGLRPVNSYLKVVADFCEHRGELIFGCNDASKFDNPLVGQAHSNLWFTTRPQLAELGRPRGYGGPWLADEVPARTQSDPYLFAGYLERCVHLHHRSDGPVRFQFVVGNYKGYEEVLNLEVPPETYVHHEFPPEIAGDWIRVRPDQDVRDCTVRFHYGPGGGSVTDAEPFRNLAKVGSAGSCTVGVARPRGKDLGTMHLLSRKLGADGEAGEPTYYEMGPDLQLTAKPEETEAAAWLADKARIEPGVVTVDAASVVYEHEGVRYRLPKGRSAFDALYAADAPGGPPRAVREVVTERSLLHAHGTFYVLPRDSAAGAAGLIPVASHERRIHDFMSWRGLLVMTGVRADAPTDVRDGGHICSAEDGTAVWVGDVDDLWKLGKPRGTGGPWRETPVTAGEPSDPYLMTGYDQKKVALRHDAEGPVTFRLQVDVALDGEWLDYATLQVPAGETVEHVFPDGYHAHWIRVVADRDCRATATLTYE